jgi:hypothetical protein
MTFEDWQATWHEVAIGLEHDILEAEFGYVPVDVVAVYVYDWAGVVCELRNGQYFTHIDRSEYTGTLAEIERRLWEDYAQAEVATWTK